MYSRALNKVVLTWTGRWSIYCSVIRIFWLVAVLCSCYFVLVCSCLFDFVCFVFVFGFVTGPVSGPWNNCSVEFYMFSLCTDHDCERGTTYSKHAVQI